MRLDSSYKEYERLRLVKDTKWSSVAYKQLNDLLDPINISVAEFVNATGASQREDRLGLAQLLVSVHSAFMRLERALTDSQQDVVAIFNGGGSALRGIPTAVPATLTFGPPYLRLATNVRQVAYRTDMVAQMATRLRTAIDEPENPGLLQTIVPLSKLEDALAHVERTAKRVMTHSSLGLGDPKPDLGDPKADLGDPKADLGDPKADLGDPKADLGDPKADLGDPKADLGLFSFLPAAGGYLAAMNGTESLTESYRRVARSLQLLEDGVARIESDIATALSTAENGSNPEYAKRITDQMNRSFRGLHELVSNARLTMGSVLANPSSGLGPSSTGGLGASRRQQLAIAGGLSSRALRLL
jgi:hypothetical protein